MTEKISRRRGLSSFDDLLQESLAKDEAFAERWKISEVVARFGVRVFKERTRQGVSQETLAEEVGTGQPNISRIEHGAANPTLETMAKIARALGVDLEELLQQSQRETGPTVTIRGGGREGRILRVHETKSAEPWKGSAQVGARRLEEGEAIEVDTSEKTALAS